jgi:hypothetical protein
MQMWVVYVIFFSVLGLFFWLDIKAQALWEVFAARGYVMLVQTAGKQSGLQGTKFYDVHEEGRSHKNRLLRND